MFVNRTLACAVLATIALAVGNSSFADGPTKSDDRYLASVDVKNGNVVDVLGQLFKKRGVDYIIREGVQGKVTCSFHEFDWDLVIRYVAGMVGAKVIRDRNGVYIVELEKKTGVTSETMKPGESAKPPSMIPSPAPSGDNEQKKPAPSSDNKRLTIARIPIRNVSPGYLATALTANPFARPIGSYFLPITPLGYGFPGLTFFEGPPGYAMQYYNLCFGWLP